MGFHFLGSSSSYDEKPLPAVNVTVQIPPVKQPQPANPDPYNFRIVKSKQVGKWLLVKVKYPDCTNYEGMKILLYKGITLKQLTKQGHLDPHFSNSKKFHSPFARFEPTDKGWDFAVDFVYDKIIRKISKYA